MIRALRFLPLVVLACALVVMLVNRHARHTAHAAGIKITADSITREFKSDRL